MATTLIATSQQTISRKFELRTLCAFYFYNSKNICRCYTKEGILYLQLGITITKNFGFSWAIFAVTIFMFESVQLRYLTYNLALYANPRQVWVKLFCLVEAPASLSPSQTVRPD